MNNFIDGPFTGIHVILPSEKSDYSVVEKSIVEVA